MQILNLGKRTFLIGTMQLKPQETALVEDVQGQKMADMYPNEIKILEVKKVVEEEVKPVEKKTKKATK